VKIYQLFLRVEVVDFTERVLDGVSVGNLELVECIQVVVLVEVVPDDHVDHTLLLQRKVGPEEGAEHE